MHKQLMRGAAVLGAVAIVASACVDLDISNTRAPDREQALAEASSVESLIAGTFDVYFGVVHDGTSVNHLFPNLGPQVTATPWAGAIPQTREPRPTFDNSPDIPAATGPDGPRDLWAGLNEVLSSAYDGLRAVRVDGVKFTSGSLDNTPRAEAFGKFMQGLAWGYLATIFDQVIVIPETEALQSDAAEQVRQALVPWEEGLEAALGALDEAIAIAEENSFSFPSSSETYLWFGSPSELTSQQFVELANTMAARFLVLSARTPAERAALDWSRVLAYTDNGLTYDFGTSLSTGNRSSWLLSGSQAVIEVSSDAVCCYRLSYRVVGPADTSGRYQEWIAMPPAERMPFLVETPDRRITGALPTLSGSYVRYRSNFNGFNATAGTYRQSHYQWGRHAIRHGVSPLSSSYNNGFAYMATADENNLLRAEALLRLGDAQGAAELINITRTRSQTASGEPNLPPVTAAGVPESPSCVPRTDTGECGSLLTALRYERILETLNLDAIIGYADMRGFGMLPEGTFLQQPIPGNELDLLQMPIYSYGGVGTEFGAVYQPTD